MAILVLLNAFFAYFCILVGYRRGVVWQQAFLAAALVQFFVEVVLFETMECMWVNCVIPLIVSNDVPQSGDFSDGNSDLYVRSDWTNTTAA